MHCARQSLDPYVALAQLLDVARDAAPVVADRARGAHVGIIVSACCTASPPVAGANQIWHVVCSKQSGLSNMDRGSPIRWGRGTNQLNSVCQLTN
jgi:hypothetical protein